MLSTSARHARVVATRRVVSSTALSARVNSNSKRLLSEGGSKPAASASAAPKGSSVPPPPPNKPADGGSSSSSTGLIVAALLAAGATVYFKDDILKAVNPPAQAAKPASEKKPAEAPAAAAPAPAAVAAPAAAPAAAPQKEEKPALPVAEVKKEVAIAERRLDAVKAVAEGKTPNVDYTEVRKAIAELLDGPGYDDGSYGPLFVRLAWHASGTYDKVTNTGGSEGATMRFPEESNWGANAGLLLARDRLESVKSQFPGLTYADLWTLAGSVAIEEMGGPKISWRSGRKDAVAGPSPLPDGRLPDADGRDHKDAPAEHLRFIFGKMGFDDREIVALSGAHALGRCHTDRSGFWGPWTRAPTTFSNEYFKLLLSEEWKEKKTHLGKPWNGPGQFEDKTGELMMLPTDLSLIQDPKMRVWVEKYAADEKLFFDDFARAWTKLTELGVKRFHGTRRYYFFGPRE